MKKSCVKSIKYAKLKIAILAATCFLFTHDILSANLPCSGKKGGISHCDGAKFICNDESVSQSSKDCSAVFNSVNEQTSTNLEAISSTELTANYTGNISNKDRILELNYSGFTVWLDCNERGAIKFRYNAQHDSGSEHRVSDFYHDTKVPAECQQLSTKAYGNHYDRGHLVPANHLDGSKQAIQQTNFITNILPQAANMNRGAWLQTEELIECYRDIDELLVVGGVLWGNDASNDYFIKSHGVRTPDAFWKVIVRGSGQDERAIAWIVPNTQDAKRANLDKYLVSVDEIEQLTHESIPVADYAKHDKPSYSWQLPLGCDKG